MEDMNFNKEGSPYEKIGIGRISQAEIIYGLSVIFRDAGYLIVGKDLHSILEGLVKKEILWIIIDSYLPVSPQNGDKCELRFVKNPSSIADISDQNFYGSLRSLKGKAVNYQGKLYIIPPTDNT